MRRFLVRLANVFRDGHAERELTRELAAHLALMEDEYQRRGMTVEQASRAARLALGGIEQTKERHRQVRSLSWLEDARRDGEHAMRLLRRNPVFALTAALSVAIGIGANTAIFTVANALLFRDPVGVAQPHRLVTVGVSRPDGGLNPASYPAYRDIRERTTTLTDVYAHGMFPHAVSLTTGGETAVAERAFSYSVSTNYFTALGAVPFAGRLFGTGDTDLPGASPFVVLSHQFWQRRFGADVAAVGRTIRLNGKPFTIVGIAAERFQGTGIVAPDLWVPMGMAANASGQDSVLTNRRGGFLTIGARLAPGVSIEQGAAEIDALGTALHREYEATTATWGLRLVPSSTVPGNRNVLAVFLTVLTVVAMLVLAVACANLAGILLARTSSRRRELAVRFAIGAARARLVRQLLTETMMLFAIGAAAGVALARAMTSLAQMLPSLPFPVAVPLALDWRVVGYTMALSLAASLVCGLAPALRASKVDAITALKDESQGPSGRSRLRSGFVVVQLAGSMTLVVVATLFVQSLRRVDVNPGFDPDGVELATVNLGMANYTEATGPRFWRELIERVRQIPDVESATLARVPPGGFEGVNLAHVDVPGAPRSDFDPPLISWNIVEPEYFSTLRIPLLAGRDFTARDLPGTPLVTIIGETAARRLWPGENPIGKVLSYRPIPGESDRALSVIGVVGDIKSSSLIDGQAGSYVYLPLQQHYATNMTASMTIVARGRRGGRIAGALSDAVAALDARLPLVASGTLEQSRRLGLTPQRIMASMAGSLGTFGMLLAAIGVYGLTAYAVARRTREIGIRIALGAGQREVIGMVIGQGLALVVIGLSVGLLCAVAVGRVLSGFLFGIPALNPGAVAVAAVTFAAIALVACYVPARAATRIDPVVALRRE